MNLLLWLLVLAWSLEAAIISVPWFAGAGVQVFTWIRSGQESMLHIVGFHAFGALAPPFCAWALWRRREIPVCLALTGLASAWLFLMISLGGWTGGWLLRGAPKVALCVVTLLVVLRHALRQAHRAPG